MMKFSVGRTILKNALGRFITKGQSSLLSKNENLIHETIISVEGEQLTITGTDDSNIIFSEINLPCEIEEEGEIFLSDVDLLYSLVKWFKGNKLTIRTSPTEIIVSDEKQEMSDSLQAVPIPKELKQFREMHGYRDGNPGQQHEKFGSFEFEKWFTIPDGRVFKDLEKIAMKENRSDVWNISTMNTIHFKNENIKMSKCFTYNYEGEIHSEKDINVEWIHPIFNNVSGETEFWIYISTKGNIQLWIHNREVDWFVRYDVNS